MKKTISLRGLVLAAVLPLTACYSVYLGSPNGQRVKLSLCEYVVPAAATSSSIPTATSPCVDATRAKLRCALNVLSLQGDYPGESDELLTLVKHRMAEAKACKANRRTLGSLYASIAAVAVTPTLEGTSAPDELCAEATTAMQIGCTLGWCSENGTEAASALPSQTLVARAMVNEACSTFPRGGTPACSARVENACTVPVSQVEPDVTPEGNRPKSLRSSGEHMSW